MKTKEELLKEFEEFTFKGKQFKIYKWENKPYRDLINNLPKNERLATFQEFNKAIKGKAFEMEVRKDYITKHFNKLQLNKRYCLSRSDLYSVSNMCFNYSLLSDYHVNGRVVVIVEDLK
jgi:hypothetical protein